jgi:predicted amidohydrolase YtcJ
VNRNLIVRSVRLAMGIVAMLTAAQCMAAGASADLILTGGQLYTPSGWQEALAVRDGIIVAVGKADEIASHRGPHTTVVELNGRAVFPGLHDMHVHSFFAGMEQFQCRFAYGAKPRDIVDAVRKCAQQAPAGAWIEGGNWVGAVFAKGEQHRKTLDAAAPHNPVALSDEAHHSLWVNSRALELAKITRATADPPGGIIERDASGEPTGVLRETATRLVEAVLPAPSDAAMRNALTLSTNQMLSYGITSYTEATVHADNMTVLSNLSREGVLKQRVRGCIVWTPGDPEGPRLIAERARYATPRFKPDCVKMFLDGVPTESHTAAMLQPYEGVHSTSGASADKGILMMSKDQLDTAVREFDAQGLHIKFHAVGDAAVRAAIDAVEKARNTNGWGGPMHDVGHNSFVDPADVPRVRAVHMAWEFSPYIWYPTPIVDVDVRRAVGGERLARFIPIRDAVETGAPVVAGSDWSVVPSVNPWLAIETMVTRRAPGGSKDAIAEGQRITLEQALRIFTSEGAAVMGHRDRVGSLETGMHADLVVTETNPFRVPIGQVHATKVVLTVIGGEKVYDAASPPPLTAE